MTPGYTMLHLDQDELAGVKGYWRWSARVQEKCGYLDFQIEEIEVERKRGWHPNSPRIVFRDTLVLVELQALPVPMADDLLKHTSECIDIDEIELRREIAECEDSE